MSRAFVNEDNAAADAEQPVERLVSAQTNYVTAHGLTLLKEHVSSLQAQHSARKMRWARPPTNNASPTWSATCATSPNACKARRW
ncbi:hypothetical protein BV364_00663 [Pseudomonas syringae pv. actinidiae]|nr:hypothetical protein BV364_00663 [Pseudomonas syringae pv. actinidiae]